MCWDVLEALADAYDEVKILTAEEMKENEEKGIDDSSEFFLGTNVEILIASELFEIPGDALTDSQRRLCDRIMERSRKKCRRSGINRVTYTTCTVTDFMSSILSSWARNIRKRWKSRHLCFLCRKKNNYFCG